MKSPEVKTNAVCMLKDKKGKFTKSKSLKHSVVRVEEMKKGKVICGTKTKLTYESDNILKRIGSAGERKYGPTRDKIQEKETRTRGTCTRTKQK